MFNLKTITQSMTSYLNNSLPHVLIAGLSQLQETKCQLEEDIDTQISTLINDYKNKITNERQVCSILQYLIT